MTVSTRSTLQPETILQSTFTTITGQPFPGKETAVADTTVEWHFVTNKNKVNIFKGVNPTVPDLLMFKGEGVIPFDMQDVFNCCYGTEMCKLIDPLLIMCNVHDKLDSDTHVLHSRYHVGWPITDREFYYMETKQMERSKEQGGDCYLIAHQSMDVPHTELPNTIRGIIHQAGWLFEQVPTATPESPATKVTFLAQVDLKGWMPKFILNYINQEEALVIAKIADFLTNRQHDYQELLSSEHFRPVTLDYKKL